MKITTVFKAFSTSFLLLLALFALPNKAAAAPDVFVTIAPQKYFLQKIAGDLVNVHVLVQPGANPHTYEPTPEQMVSISRAKAYFAIGINLEETWLPRINAANSSMRIVYTQRGITKIPMLPHSHSHEGDNHATIDHDKHKNETAQEQHHDHSGHTGCCHAHGSHDPHIWLDPILVRQVATNIYKGLVKIDRAHKAQYATNLALFLTELETLDKAITQKLQALPTDKRTFMVFHPSWGYFAKRYGLTQMAIEDKGSDPGPRHIANIISYCREHEIKVLFVQPQFSRKSAQVIAGEIDATVTPLDPLALNWKQNLLQAADAFAKNL